MRDRQSVIAVIAVVLVVLGFIGIANAVTKHSDSSDTSAAADATSGAAAGATATSASPTTATPVVLPGCTKAPAPQASPKQEKAPDISLGKDKTYTAVLKTNCGDITATLDGTKAPATVSSFVNLANTGYWSPSTPCHRLTGDAQGLWVLQCGDPTGTGSGAGPGYHFGVENAPANGVYPRGTLAMARTSDPNSNADQFFIVYKDTTLPTTGGGYTIFGTVTGGMDIVDKVAAAGINPDDQTSPLAPLSILSVTATLKG